MKAKNADDIRRRALALGAEVVIAGRAFNTAGLRVVATRPQPTAKKGESAPVVVPVAPVLDAQVLAEAVAAGVRAALPPAPPPQVSVPRAREQHVTPTYDRHGRITSMAVSADGKQTHRVRVVYDADDQIQDLVITRT